MNDDEPSVARVLCLFFFLCLDHMVAFEGNREFGCDDYGERDGECPYVVLGVCAAASQEDIAKSYRRKALELHPDKNGNSPTSIAAFHELQKAFAVLSDAHSREDYDADDMLDRVRFFRPPRPSSRQQQQLHRPEVFVHPRMACEGGVATLPIARPSSVECPDCGGEGQKYRGVAAAGLSFREMCDTCEGRRVVSASGPEESFRVCVPVGVREGTELIATSEGSEGSSVVVVVRYSTTDDVVAIHKESGDAEIIHSISVADALCGGFRLTGVEDLGGRLHDVDVPVGRYNPPGSVVRVPGGGLPPAGDLVIRFAVDWPSTDDGQAADPSATRRFRKRIRTHAHILWHILQGPKKNI